jgi:hypothetical protein
MTGHHKFKQLIENISPERKARIEKPIAQLKEKIVFNELQQVKKNDPRSTVPHGIKICYE